MGLMVMMAVFSMSAIAAKPNILVTRGEDSGAQYLWCDNVILGVAYTYFNGGDAAFDQTRGPLAGRLQGDFSNNETHFLNFTIKKLFQ